MELLDIEHAKKLLDNRKCEKGLRCTKSGLGELCAARDIRNDEFLICQEKDKNCSFALEFVFGYMCKCPVRLYIAKEYGH